MKLERNARICRNCFFFWAIPYTIYIYYLSLFLEAEGLSTSNIGLLMTVANASALVFSLVAAPIVDRMGRRNATFVFDLISSALPCLLFLAGGKLVVALIAQAITGLNRIMSTGYYLLMIEDTGEDNSIGAMNWFNIILVGAGLCTPIGGFVVSRMGLVDGEKLFLILSFISMTAQAIVRHILVKETPTGERMRVQRSSISLRETIGNYRNALKYMFSNKPVLSAMIINGLVYAYYTIGTTISMFFAPYFADFRGLTGVTLGMVGGIYAGGTLFSMLLINPRIKPKQLYPATIISALISILGFALLMLCPQGNTALLFIAIVLISLSYGVLKTIADSLLALQMTSEHSTTLYSFSFILASVLGIVAIQILQVLYTRSPNWLFGSSTILIALVLLDAVIFSAANKKK
ncbi:MAG: MFS transporter [Spirochaetales bacterium]|nr:MFS transporter [Spirochaetales bacterium]